MSTVLFVCLHNAGRSQMSAALFNRAAAGTDHHALSAGSIADPTGHIHPEVIAVMHEISIDLTAARPVRLSAELAAQADTIVTMGCGDTCPYIPGKHYINWDLRDPKDQPLEVVRATRDEIARHVAALLAEL